MANKLSQILIVIILTIFIFLYQSSKINALEVIPKDVNFNFEPGKEISGEITIINSENKDIQVIIIFQGEFNNSLTLSDVSFNMNSSEKEKKIQYNLKMPSFISPGLHTEEINILPISGESSKGVDSARFTINIHTDKYIEASLSVIPETQDKINFIIPITNKGNSGLSFVRADIIVYGALGEKISEFKTDEIKISKGETKDLFYNWNTKLNPGTYKALALISYDTEKLELERQFSIGNPALNLQQIEVNDFSLGEIAKFELLVENQGREEIKNAYAEMEIFDKQKKPFSNIKSSVYSISNLSKKLMVIFWDTTEIGEGIYDSSVYLKFNNQEIKKDFKLDIQKDTITALGINYVPQEAKKNNLSTSLLIIVGILILINLVWFLIIKNFLHKK